MTLFKLSCYSGTYYEFCINDQSEPPGAESAGGGDLLPASNLLWGLLPLAVVIFSGDGNPVIFALMFNLGGLISSFGFSCVKYKGVIAGTKGLIAWSKNPENKFIVVLPLMAMVLYCWAFEFIPETVAIFLGATYFIFVALLLQVVSGKNTVKSNAKNTRAIALIGFIYWGVILVTYSFSVNEEATNDVPEYYILFGIFLVSIWLISVTFCNYNIVLIAGDNWKYSQNYQADLRGNIEKKQKNGIGAKLFKLWHINLSYFLGGICLFAVARLLLNDPKLHYTGEFFYGIILYIVYATVSWGSWGFGRVKNDLPEENSKNSAVIYLIAFSTVLCFRAILYNNDINFTLISLGICVIFVGMLMINFEIENRFGLTSLVVGLAVAGWIVLFRDNQLAAWFGEGMWVLRGEYYFAVVALSATAFTLLLAFRITRISTRTAEEERLVYSLQTRFSRLDRSTKNNLIEEVVRSNIMVFKQLNAFERQTYIEDDNGVVTNSLEKDIAKEFLQLLDYDVLELVNSETSRNDIVERINESYKKLGEDPAFSHKQFPILIRGKGGRFEGDYDKLLRLDNEYKLAVARLRRWYHAVKDVILEDDNVMMAKNIDRVLKKNRLDPEFLKAYSEYHLWYTRLFEETLVEAKNMLKYELEKNYNLDEVSIIYRWIPRQIQKKGLMGEPEQGIKWEKGFDQLWRRLEIYIKDIFQPLHSINPDVRLEKSLDVAWFEKSDFEWLMENSRWALLENKNRIAFQRIRGPLPFLGYTMQTSTTGIRLPDELKQSYMQKFQLNKDEIDDEKENYNEDKIYGHVWGEVFYDLGHGIFPMLEFDDNPRILPLKYLENWKNTELGGEREYNNSKLSRLLDLELSLDTKSFEGGMHIKLCKAKTSKEDNLDEDQIHKLNEIIEECRDRFKKEFSSEIYNSPINVHRRDKFFKDLDRFQTGSRYFFFELCVDLNKLYNNLHKFLKDEFLEYEFFKEMELDVTNEIEMLNELWEIANNNEFFDTQKSYDSDFEADFIATLEGYNDIFVKLFVSLDSKLNYGLSLNGGEELRELRRGLTKFYSLTVSKVDIFYKALKKKEEWNSMLFKLIYDTILLRELKAIDKSKKLEDFEPAYDLAREELEDRVKFSTPGSDEEEYLTETLAELDGLTHSKQYGREYGEPTAVVFLGLLTFLITLLTRPRVGSDEVDILELSLTGMIFDGFSFIFAGTILFLTFHIFDLHSDRSVSILDQSPRSGGHYRVEFRDRVQTKGLIFSIFCAVIVLIVVSVLIWQKWI